jgi:hypothetical protein
MQDYKNQILDEPEPKKTPKPKLKGLGIPLGFMAGITINFIIWTLIHFMVTMKTDLIVFISAGFVLTNVTAILYLIFSLYKFHKAKLIFINGLFSYISGLILFMKIIEQKTWRDIFYKPHLFSYPVLSILILELLILLAWIMIIKQKKRALGIILLMIIMLLGLATH